MKTSSFLVIAAILLILGCSEVIRVNSGDEDQLNRAYQVVPGSGNLVVNKINSFGISSYPNIYAIQRQGAVEELVTSTAVTELIIADITGQAGVSTADLLFIDRIEYKDNDVTGAVHSSAGYEFPAPGVSENIYFEQLNIIPWRLWKEGQYLDVSDLSVHDSEPLEWDLLFTAVDLNNSTMNIIANEGADCGLYPVDENLLPGYTVIEEDLAVTVNNINYFRKKVVFKTEEGNFGYLRIPGQFTDGGQKGVQLFIYYYDDGRTYLN